MTTTPGVPLTGFVGNLDLSNGTVTVPAATAATHAAQVSAINATTGRLATGGIEKASRRANGAPRMPCQSRE